MLEIQKLLGYPVLAVSLDLLEIQDTDVNKVVRQKAQSAYEQLKKPVLVEDSGLFINAWNGLPGALIHWFLNTVGNEGICQMLKSFENLQAVAVTSIGFFDGQNTQIFTGSMDGEITRQPRGQMGFGWDPIFRPAGFEKTLAEMTLDEKNAVSMRAKAIIELKKYIEIHGI